MSKRGFSIFVGLFGLFTYGVGLVTGAIAANNANDRVIDDKSYALGKIAGACELYNKAIEVVNEDKKKKEEDKSD